MINPSAREYLEDNAHVRVAHLVEVELAGTDGVFTYLTDFRANVPFDGKVYEAGKVINVSNVTLTQGLTNYTVAVTVPGEIDSEAQKATSDSSYEGRRLKIYRAYLNEQNQVIEMQGNGPLVLFEGQITDISLEDPIVSSSSEVTWECVGDLQDFEKVAGRETDDTQHRALVTREENGVIIEEPSDAAYREEYKTDTGFLHAGHTVTAAIPYLTKEKQYYFKRKWHGLSGSLRTRDVEVEREIDLNVSLEVKHLPVIYGVQNTQGIPVFADVLKSDPSRAYVVYAVCEGEIEGFLNVYVNSASAMCGPGANREESAVCVGNMANGDTLSTYVRTSNQNYMRRFWNRYPYNRGGEIGIVSPPYMDIPPWRDTEPTEEDLPTPIFIDTSRPNTEGTRHGERFTIGAEGGPITLTFYHGTPNQAPDSVLTQLAAENKFLLQNIRRKPDGSAWGPEYWQAASTGVSGAALLDTAYVVAEFTISEDRTEIPTLEFVVQGRPAMYFDNGAIGYKQTLNPVWHALDYMTNDRFGAAVPVEKFDKASWEYTAAKNEIIDDSYEQDYVINWRYVGWKSLSDENRAIMQCNTLIDTSQPVTREVETLLQHFRGTIIPWRGFYHMSNETDDDPVANISVDEVLGSVRIESVNNRDKWNSITASIQNPAENWGSTQVSFFNSDYLAEDKGIRKQGRAAFSHFTNYYTARSWSQYLLNSSRIGKTVTITVGFKYFYLKPNDNVTFTHERHGFVAPNNKFRVTSVQDSPDGTIELTLFRYDSSSFDRALQSKQDSDPGPGEVLIPPQNLDFLELPSPLVNVSSPAGKTVGILFWDVPDVPSKVLRFDIDGIVQVPKDQVVTISGTNRIFAIVEIEPSTTYTFKVSTVYNDGQRSAYSVKEITTSASISPDRLDPVTGFQVTNAVPGTKQFVGPDLIMVWDAYPVSYDNFQIQIRDDQNNLLLSTNTTNNQYTYTFAQNSSAFNSAEGKIGAYRALSPRVRAVKGGTVSEWTDL